MQSLLLMFYIPIIIAIVIIYAIYMFTSWFLSKFYLLVYGKKSKLAWWPILNLYVLGKLTINKATGWILLGCLLLISSFSVTVNGITTVYAILPGTIRSTFSIIYGLVVFGLFIYAIVKYNDLKKEKKEE